MEKTDSQVTIGENIVVSDLADKLDVSAASLVGELMKNGVMATLNDTIDFDTASIVAEELGHELKLKQPDKKQKSLKSTRKLSDKAAPRPPVVAVMGHVDHGKTTLLDAIRNESVVDEEAGGITQHISAYQIEYNDRKVTFLDTPGHEAFAALREHGAALTDVALLVVAANDGVMPQTKQAIDFAQHAGVKIVVAINKTDAPGADVNKTKTQLSEVNLTPEDWGGDTVMVEISALKKENIDSLLDMVLLVADIDEHKAETNVPAEGIVIESHMAVGQGAVATLLVEHGILRAGDFVTAGGTYAKIRKLENDRGQKISEAGPSTPATIYGFKEAPVFGQRFQQFDSEKEARKNAQTQRDQQSKDSTTVVKSATGSDVLAQIDTEKAAQKLNVLVKADVQGSLKSVVESLESIGKDGIGIKVVASGIGDISESDISAAEASGAIVYGFNVNVSPTVKRLASRTGVSLKIYKVIYELLDDAKATLEGQIEPEIVETEIGTLEIKGVFRTTQKSVICGGEVKKGKIVSGTTANILRDGENELGQAEITSVQKGKEAVKEVLKGDECGLELKTESKINLKKGDKLVAIQREAKKVNL